MKTLAILLLLVLPRVVMAENVVVTGTVIDQFKVRERPHCPPESICLGLFVGITIDVKRSLVGPALSGLVRAAWVQTEKPKDSFFRNIRLVVLQPIDDKDERKRLGVDYYVVDVGRSNTLICLRGNPVEYGLDTDGLEIVVQRDSQILEYCIEASGEHR